MIHSSETKDVVKTSVKRKAVRRIIGDVYLSYTLSISFKSFLSI